MPILGILASSTAVAAGSFESIATVTLGGNATSAEFTSIPSTFSHLQIRAIIREDRATFNNDNIKIQFNSDTAGNYSWHYVAGDGSSPFVDAGANASWIRGTILAAGQGTGSSNTFGAGIIDILDYKDTNKNKTARILGGLENNGSGYITFTSGNWRNTNAITSIKLSPENATNFTQYSHFALYGIKSA